MEAGGVEPPSEEPCNQKTTCLSHSIGFAGDAQSGQETEPTSPIDLATVLRTERRKASPLSDASIRVRGHARGDELR